MYNKHCPIQNAGDEVNCKPKYYRNSMWEEKTKRFPWEKAHPKSLYTPYKGK
jgi:hypothetical protein